MMHVEDPFGIVFEIYTHRYELSYSSAAYSDREDWGLNRGFMLDVRKMHDSLRRLLINEVDRVCEKNRQTLVSWKM